MKMRKNIKIGMFFVVSVLLIFSVSAYSRVNPNYGAFNSFVGDTSLFGELNCKAGQDFILQIAPFGCTPAVVRSDLLEEQNVPVFCQIAATKINPLITVDAIEGISFSGEYPKEVSGVGFHPARAALGVQGDLNSPILNNIGYAVIVLKKEEVEANMPDSVEGNLTARIRYDIKNAFGIGKATYYLPEIKNEDWEAKKNQYSFWEGRGYLRAESIDESGATIKIVDDIRQVGSVNLDKGETSRKISIPGFDCLANLQIRLDGLVSPDTRAKLEINGEIVEVAEGEKFLDNNCKVNRINKKGIIQEVEIRCKTDDSRSEKLSLKISPKIKLGIEGVDKTDFEIGDYLYEADNEKSVYLGYVGTVGDTGRKEDLYVYLIVMPKGRTKLTGTEVSEVARLAHEYEYQRITGVGSVDILANAGKSVFAVSSNLYKYVVEGKGFERVGYQKIERFSGTDIQLMGYAGAEDLEFSEKVRFEKELAELESELDTLEILDISSDDDFSDKIEELKKEIEELKKVTEAIGDSDLDIKENYDNAMKDYDSIINSFPNEWYDEANKVTYGEEALYQKIVFAYKSEQKRTALEFCENFKTEYPESKKNIKEYCDEEWRLSNTEISTKDIAINNRVKRISFKGIYEPSKEEYSAEIVVRGPNGNVRSFILGNEQIVNLVGFRDEDKNEFIQLVSLDERKARIKINLYSEGFESLKKETISTDTKTLEENVPESFGSGYVFTLTNVKLKKVAKVTVLPNIDNAGTTVSFPFKVGIEKRAIQLSPEKTKEMIDNLDDTIDDWEDKSSKLGNVVQGLKGACLATGAYLTVKNFLSNTDGKSIARQEVMTGTGGWNEKCSNAVSSEKKLAGSGTIEERTVNYKTINECLTKESDNIDEDVELYSKAIDKQNNEIKSTQEGCDSTQFLTETHIDTACFKEKYAPVVKSELENSLDLEREIDVGGGENVKVSEILKGVNIDSVSVEQLKRIQLNSRIDSPMANAQLDKDLKDIYINTKTEVERTSFSENAVGITGARADNFGNKDSVQGIYRGAKADSSNPVLNSGTPVKLITYNGKKYYLELEETNRDEYHIKNIYDSSWTLLHETSGQYEEGEYDNNVQEINSLLSKGFKEYDSSTYENPFKSVSGETEPVVKFYETEPYKGLPAIVPFDLKKGWYAATRQTLPVLGGIQPYDESGRVTSVWVCNVGENGIAEFKSGIGDDVCEMVNLGTGQSYNNFPGLSESDSAKIVKCAVDAIEDASNYKSGNNVRISTSCGGTISVSVGKPAVDVPEMQCQDFMSPSDCQLLFNVCDPVICPSSRCNLGGTYYVKDVIQSGIIGSVALCLPNIREGIYMPVCLTGIKAGIDGYLSIVKSHRDCLQESLDTGETVGICDEIYSIHLCEFFWRQSLPVANLVLPKLLEVALGQNTRGGGEYLGVQDAWGNAQKSITYFTQYYAANSFEAFKARTAEGVGGEVCQNFASGVYPEGGNLLDALTEPDSPPQYHGRFDETLFTSATVPSTSHYKVYYHVYAGKDRGVYYQVYLTEGEESSFYKDTDYRRVVDSGYIARGEYASETVDFTAPTGYKKMCIRVNNQEECGFKQVSTSYAVNYVEDKFMEEQTSKTDIKSETECISGSASLYSLVSPSLQGAGEEIVNPAIYERGIIRICSTGNPGLGSDSKANGEGSRWVEVGYCDYKKIKCWMDKNSVSDVIEDLNIEGKTLSDLEENSLKILEAEGDYESRDTIQELIKEKEEAMQNEEYSKVIKIVNEIFVRVFWNDQKVILLLNRANAYARLIGEEKRKLEKPKQEAAANEDDEETGEKEEDGCEDYCKGDREQGVEGAIKISYSFWKSEVSRDSECSQLAGDEGVYLYEDNNKCCCYEEEPSVEESKCQSLTCGTSSIGGTQKVMAGDSCWQSIGNELIKVAEDVKKKLIAKDSDRYSYLQDTNVMEELGVAKFECLVLMVARQEGCLSHCVYDESENNPLYCDGVEKDVMRGDDGSSIGIMQINKDVHGEKYGFFENVEYAANLLSSRYSSSLKSYVCGGKNYAGWQRALRYYNGWNTDCSKGDIDYVENVLSKKDEIIRLFPECK